MFNKKKTRIPSGPWEMPKRENNVSSWKKLRRHSQFFWGVLFFILVSFISGIVSFIFVFFQVDRIQISRESNDLNLPYEELVEIMKATRNKNIIWFPSHLFAEKIKIVLPTLSEVSIEKKYPGTLKVYAKTSEIIARWEYFYQYIDSQPIKKVGYLNIDGLFLPHGPEEVFVIEEKDFRSQILVPSQELFPVEDLSQLLTVKNNLEALIERSVPRGVFLRSAQEFHFIDENGTKYWFFLGDSLDDQLEKLREVLLQKNILENHPEYIDLRITRKVIYKP